MTVACEVVLPPADAGNMQVIAHVVQKKIGRIPPHFRIVKRSIDARGRTPVFRLQIEISEQPFADFEIQSVTYNSVNAARPCVIIGAGPAGIFAALECIKQGIRPIIFERGKDVRARRHDLAAINREGIVHPDSNYCFGEGGAGTYSDGKLYTRSDKRGNIRAILETFVQFGADPDILVDAHPHIGTNRLPGIIAAMRNFILDAGGEIYFECRVSDIKLSGDRVAGIMLADGRSFDAENIILATGHSARDIFELLHTKGIAIEAKPFALGVRIEHPQELVDRFQYHCSIRESALPPASYSFSENINGRGVYSFCMCPGGIIAPCATAAGEVVTNGWSPSKRNNPHANSGFVVSVELRDLKDLQKHGPLAGIYFQRAVESACFSAGGGALRAPAQRMVDFVLGNHSVSLPACSYHPGLNSFSLKEVLPDFVTEGLKTAFKNIARKRSAYYTNEAVLVATESRTSSPVRIPRDPKTLQHVHVKGLYPCGEGAGYAGGIISAAMDGLRVAEAVSVNSSR